MAGRAGERPADGSAGTIHVARRGTAGMLVATTTALLVLVAASSAATSVPDGLPVDGARPAFAAAVTTVKALLVAAAGLLWLRHLADSVALPRSGIVVAGALGAAAFLVMSGGDTGAALFTDPAGGFGAGVLGARSGADVLALVGGILGACLALRLRPNVRQGIVLGLAVGLGVLAVETGLVAAANVAREEALDHARRWAGPQGPPGWVLVGSRWGLAGIGVDAAAAALLGAALALLIRHRPAVHSLVLPAALLAAAIATLLAWDAAASDLARSIRLAIDPAVQPGMSLLDFRLTGITTLLLAGPALVLAAVLWRREAPGEALVAPPALAPRPRSRPIAPLLAALAAVVLLEAERVSALLSMVLASEVVPSTVTWWFPGAIVTGLLLATPAVLLITAGARRAAVPARAIVLGLVVMALLEVISGGLPITVLARALGTEAAVKSVTITPVVEELTKLLAIALVAPVLAGRSSIRAGIVLGAAAGLAFNLVEVAHHVQIDAATQPALVASTFALRMANGGVGLHVATASILGGALAAARRPGAAWSRAAVLALGLAVALATHAAWNAFGEDLVNRSLGVLDPGFPAAPPAVLAAYAVGTAFTWLLAGAALLVVALAWRRARSTPAVVVASVPSAAPSDPAAALEAPPEPTGPSAHV